MGYNGNFKMKNLSQQIEIESLKKLQSLSEQISDLIQKGNYEKISNIDSERKKIIRTFKNKPSNKTINALKDILEKNKSLIEKVELNKDNLNKNYNKILNIFNAYK